MKIHVEQGINCDDIEITIKCSALDNNIEKIISLLSTPLLDIKGKKSGEIYKLNVCDILYFETVGNKTFAYYEDDVFEIYTTPEDFDAVEAALADAGIETVVAKITMIPDTTIELTGDDAVKMQKMLDVLDDLDDVQNVYHNGILPDDEEE